MKITEIKSMDGRKRHHYRIIFSILVPLWLISTCVYSQNVEPIESINGKGDLEKMLYYDSLSSALLMSSPEKSIEFGKQAIILAQELKKENIEAVTHKRIGYANYQLGDYTQCLECYERAIELFKSLNDDFDMAITLNLKGDVHNRLGDFNMSMNCFLQAERICDSLQPTYPDTVSLKRFNAILYTNLGILHHDLDSLEKAFDCFNIALKFASEISDSTRIAASYSNIGMIHKSRSAYDSAFVNYYHSLDISRAIDNRRYETATLNNIANMYEELGKPDSAMHYYMNAKELISQSGDKYGLSLVSRNIGKTLLKKNKAPDAIKYLNEALQISTEIGSVKEMYLNYLELSKAHKQLVNYKEALKFHELYTLNKDSVLGDETRKKVAELEIHYESEKKEKENLALRKDNEINQLKISRKNRAIVTLTAGIVFVLLSFLVMFLLYRGRYLAFRNLVKKNIEIIKVENELESTRKLLEQFKEPESPDTDEQSTELSQSKNLADKLERFMKREKPHFDSSISIDEISTKLSTNRTYLANAIKTEFAHSFNSYINEYRVKEAMRFLISPDYQNYSLEGIGQLVGFNNRMSFISNFKKITGITPGIFRDKNKEFYPNSDDKIVDL
ncbi:MAG: tetratricopeptide repeat protein [Bacteroidales bacterium]|nr:tetratricopeptide repeat protein [Bacteroidales bacterium]MCF8458990.1 tetratricopeptide repeat protein [Bacteroidales bacterium]